VLGSDKVPSKIEQITHRCMSTQKPLSLPYRLELSHSLLPAPGCLININHFTVLVYGSPQIMLLAAS
jgi:hypothetical protein